MNIRHASPLWLITFTDLMGLVLCFFVLMFAARLNGWEGVERSLRQTFSVATEAPRYPAAETNGLNLDYLASVVATRSGMDFRPSGDRLTHVAPAEQLFEGATARLSPGGERFVAAAAEALRNLPNRVEVYGHGDPASPWGLSLARAVALARALEAAGLSYRPTAFAVGDARFNEIDPNLPLAQRYIRAQRMELAIRYGRTP